MQHDILNHFGNSHAQYLHAHGEIATAILIQSLDCQSGEKVLEIGFGTGATLARLASTYKKTRFFGVDQSPLMFRKAKARLRFCCIGKAVELRLLEGKNVLPFAADSFDKVYVESVLGIQEGNDLQAMLVEIRRVLKPQGILVINETIWLDTTPLEEIARINAFGKKAFGIIQSNGDCPYLADWNALLARLHFECELVIKLSDVKHAPKLKFKQPFRFLSTCFTAYGKVNAAISRSMRKEKTNFERRMAEVLPTGKSVMEGILIKASNRK